MTLDEMRKIAAKRTPGKWLGLTSTVVSDGGDVFICRTFHPDCSQNNPSQDADFIAMAANNWNRLMVVVEAATMCIVDAFPEGDVVGDVLIDQARVDLLRKALEELKK